ncbi:hypothetical protein [Roseovarius rhodophyticola]|uniref:Uncharacterized protein n=1 Tax=Roseovarius rhodophyticola TaxID=3080827 RepID=A0ABZ2TJR4_9RHOB|nr:hypothetical protein [Roseovarius sp. W115]MDV2930293.1 hypothetical protein [Roseovarius sp. W115]
MHTFAEHTTLPMSMDQRNLVSLVTRIKSAAKATHKRGREKVTRMVSLPKIQPSNRDGWIV